MQSQAGGTRAGKPPQRRFEEALLETRRVRRRALAQCGLEGGERAALQVAAGSAPPAHHGAARRAWPVRRRGPPRPATTRGGVAALRSKAARTPRQAAPSSSPGSPTAAR
jgi:hypothetical protein